MITGKYLENPALYSPDELERLDNHIEKYFGKATTVVHEFFSEDIHVDVSIIPPHEEHNYYTLVTTGMGAFSMKIPSEYQEDGLPSRIELMMCLPPEWNPESKESQENWPVELLRYLARFPIIESTWLGYPNLEELTLMEKCEGVEVLSGLKQLHTLSLWLSAPVSWDNVSLPGLRVLHLRGEKNGDITPLLTSITYLHLEEMRKTEDLAAFLTPATRLQKLYLQSLPAVQELPALDGLPSLYALKLYELHKLNDLSALSHSHLRYFAATLIADKLSAQALADAVMAIPDLEAAALQLVDRSGRRYGGIQKAFAATGKSALLREEISALTTWLSL